MKESQISPYEHSDIKVRLLQLYLDRYMNIISGAKGITDIYVYDLFCGEGIYDNGKEGSPVIILKMIKDIFFRTQYEGKTIGKFHFTFNDYNSDKILKLQKHIQEKKLHYSSIGNLKFSCSDYQSLKKEILPVIGSKNSKSFLFIDPYGYKNISIGDIENFLKSSQTEVLLFLPTQFMYRFEKAGTPNSLWSFMNELLPNEDWSPSKSGVDFINKLRDAFRSRLDGKHYVDSFIITRDNNQFFGMFFFTSHIYGFEKFLEAKWQIDEEEGRGWSVKQKETNLFSSLVSSPKTDKFEETLKLYLKESRSNVEIHDFTIKNGHLIPHATQILKDIQNQGLLEVKRVDNQTIRKGAFFIGWNETKTFVPKCFIKIKQ